MSLLLNHPREMKLLKGVGITLGLCAALLPGMARAQFEVTTNNGTLTIVGYTGTDRQVRIPAMIDDLPVTAIGNYAFNGNSSLVRVVFPDSVTSIREGAFQNCPRLTIATFGNNLQSIGTNAFANTFLTGVKIPATVTNIAAGAFDACSRLTAFKVDTGSRFYTGDKGVLFDRGETILIKYPENRRGRYAIPAGVTNIAVNAFANSRPNKIIIPATMTSLSDNVFFGCGLLKEVVIPDSVTSIGYDAFGECTSLHRVAIPGSVTNIGTGAFSTCTNLVEVTLAEGITSIGGYAFAITRLPSVIIPASVTEIGTEAFGSTPALTHVYFKGDAPALGAYAFDGDNRATLYYLPAAAGWDSFDSQDHPLKPWKGK